MNEKIRTPSGYNYRYLWRICLIATLGGFLFGYDWGVAGGAKEFYEAQFGIVNDFDKGWGTSSVLIGCIIGALTCYALSDKLGRKRPLIVAGLLFTFPSLITWLGMSNVFLVFACVCLIGFLGVKRFLPETKGKSLEEIERHFGTFQAR